MSNQTCYDCGKQLIKQPLGEDWKPLSSDDSKKYEELLRFLECKECGRMLYREIDPSFDGIGLCKRCGGSDKLATKKQINKTFNAVVVNRGMIWSCPDHGYLDKKSE